MNRFLGALMMICLLPVASLAEEKNETFKSYGFMMHGQLGCFKESSARPQTLYIPYGGLKSNLAIKTAAEIELSHPTLIMGKCNQTVLNQIEYGARRSYGFVWGGSITIQKTQGKSQVFDGRCQTLYREKVSLDFGSGVVLESEESEWRPMKDCE